MIIFKIIKRFTLFGFGLILLLLFFSSCILQMRISDQKAKKEFQNSPNPISFHYYSYKGKKVHYAEIGNPNLPTLLFIHGSPGSWDAFATYLKDTLLQKEYHMIAVDRLGYGYSGFGHKEESVGIQAEVFKQLLTTSSNGKKTILIGHSYGGPVIARLAMDYPEKVGGLLFLAASIDPDLEPKKWIQEPATWLVFRWMIPKALVVSNEEILALKNELTLMLPMWDKIKAPSIFIQGEKDVLVHPGNAKFAEKKLINTHLKLIMLPEQNHFIPWTMPDTVKMAIRELGS